MNPTDAMTLVAVLLALGSIAAALALAALLSSARARLHTSPYRITTTQLDKCAPITRARVVRAHVRARRRGAPIARGYR